MTRPALFLFALPLILCGCVTEPVGDFGRKDASVFHDTILTDTGAWAASMRNEPVSSYKMTDEESELRNVAWDLVRPPGGGGTWNTDFVFSLQWTRVTPDVWYKYSDADYYKLLRDGGLVSHETYYERLIQQVRGDSARLPAFRDVAVRVGKADGARQSAIRALEANDAMRIEAENRIAENIRVVEWVEGSLRKRVRMYRTALGRFMIEMPSTKAVEAEAAIDALEWEVTGTRRGSVALSSVPRRSFKPQTQKSVFKD